MSLRRNPRLAVAWLTLAMLAPGCGSETPPGAPLALRGEVLIEPPTLGVGHTAWVEIAVVTPPEDRLHPPEAPTELPGLWILTADAPVVERHASHWVHRARFRIRARQTGRFEWPAQTVTVEHPDGSSTPLEITARPLVVEEIAREFPDRVVPFGLRRAPGPAAPPGTWIAALGGAAAALAGVALVWLVRRARRADRAIPRASATAPWRAAQAGLSAAEGEEDPRAAAGRASTALRRYVSHRYGVAAHTATTEELEARPPPRSLGGQWEELLQVLRRLDALRFRPPLARPDAADDDELRVALHDARLLLTELMPRNERLPNPEPAPHPRPPETDLPDGSR